MEEYVAFIQQNWKTLSEDDKKRFRTSLFNNLLTTEKLADFLDAFKTHFVYDGNFYKAIDLLKDFTVELFSVFNRFLEKELKKHISFPVISGGLFFKATTSSTSTDFSSFPLSAISFDISMP